MSFTKVSFEKSQVPSSAHAEPGTHCLSCTLYQQPRYTGGNEACNKGAIQADESPVVYLNMNTVAAVNHHPRVLRNRACVISESTVIPTTPATRNYTPPTTQRPSYKPSRTPNDTCRWSPRRTTDGHCPEQQSSSAVHVYWSTRARVQYTDFSGSHANMWPTLTTLSYYGRSADLAFAPFAAEAGDVYIRQRDTAGTHTHTHTLLTHTLLRNFHPSHSAGDWQLYIYCVGENIAR